MHTKLLLIGLISLSLLATGCQKSQTNNHGATPADNQTNQPETNTQDTSKTDENDHKYDIVGEVLTIEGNELHLITGDIVQIYTINDDSINKVYLGETVKLIENSKDDYSVEPYLIDDFTTRFTGMGLRIDSTKGNLIDQSVTDDTKRLTFEIDGKTQVFDYYGESTIKVGATYELDIINQGPTLSLSEIYLESAFIKASILELNRNDNNELIIYAKDENGGEYYIPTANAIKNFNLSELKVDDTISFHPLVIMESFPMQIITNKINRL